MSGEAETTTFTLTPEQIKQFHEDGILVVPNYLSETQINSMKNEIHTIINQIDLLQSRSIFTTAEGMKGVNRDNYFLESGDKIRHFWEENAFDEAGNPRQSLDQCINKIGHALHDLNPVFHDISYDKKVGIIARQLGLKDPRIPQSMYIFKSPHIGGKVDVHQDGSFLYTEPQSVIGFWWALDNCTIENGCLWASLGSQKNGLYRRFKRLELPEIGTEFVPKDYFVPSTDGGVPLECPKGSLVLIHHSVVHWSLPNQSSNSRHAYSIHVVDGAEGFVYPKDNWLQNSTGVFNPV